MGETRVAATPETVKKLVAAGHDILVQSGAGNASSVPDVAYAAAGAKIVDAHTAFGADMVLKVRSPNPEELPLMRAGGVLIGMLNPFDAENIGILARHGLSAFALEAAPRSTRAQSMTLVPLETASFTISRMAPWPSATTVLHS
jgi:NAD(P) transhydrogenase subunit alpha